MTLPVRIGLAGAGQWARTFHAPMLAESADVEFTGVWSARPERSAALAGEHGVPAVAELAALVAASDAIAFAVPPEVQGELAPLAIDAGRAVILEKPLAADLAGARALADRVAAAGVASVVTLTKRYHARTRELLAEAATLRDAGRLLALTGRYVHGGMLGGGFLDAREREGWRRSLGVVADLGPHLLDLAEATAGGIRALRASGDPGEAVRIETEHDGGAGGHLLLSARVAVEGSLTGLELYGHGGHVAYSTRGLGLAEVRAHMIGEFVAAVREGAPVTADAAHAVRVQRLVEAVGLSLAEGGRRVDPASV